METCAVGVSEDKMRYHTDGRCEVYSKPIYLLLILANVAQTRWLGAQNKHDMTFLSLAVDSGWNC